MEISLKLYDISKNLLGENHLDSLKTLQNLSLYVKYFIFTLVFKTWWIQEKFRITIRCLW